PYLEIEVPAGANVTAVLQWNQPALSVPANSGNGPRIDLDLLVFDSRSPFSVDTSRSSVIDQKAGTASDGFDPVELVKLEGGGTYYLAVDHWAGAQEDIPQDNGTRLEFRLVFYESGESSSIQYLDTAGGPDPAPTMYGHPVATGVFGVGAVPWYDAGPFLDERNAGPTNRIDPQPYTALGGALERHFRPDGTFRRASQGPQPVIAATDGNNTSFFGTPWPNTGLDSEAGEDDRYPNFFGTSAAAPNAAAVAALLLDDDGTLEPAEIAGKLQTSAVDVTGRNAGMGCDDVTGSGLIDAGAALLAADDAPVADAGRDLFVDTRDTVTLDGGDSSDNNFVETCRWRQVAGPRVTLSSPGRRADPLRCAPASASTLVFELRVADAACLSDADRVAVQVRGGSGGGGVGAPFLLLILLLVAKGPHACAQRARMKA
ncbi:MAG: S8 family serine peptidase, partial [Halofilum sp. (in: g-proteobacteria)]|nr:S8 family serine peptidase [Halofilum sp. (in: g-proteobacteria)]